MTGQPVELTDHFVAGRAEQERQTKDHDHYFILSNQPYFLYNQ